MNVTLVSADLNKRKIGSKSPAQYISSFHGGNSEIDTALRTHFIELRDFGIEVNDYEQFLRKRAEWIYGELKRRLELEV